MTDTLDLSKSTIQGVYFLLRKVSIKPFLCKADSEEAQQFCFSYRGSQSSIKEHLLSLIANARKKIFLASFRIGDHDLVDSLCSAAARLKGGVYVISALDEKSIAQGLEAESDDIVVDLPTLNKQFDSLTKNGIYVRGHESCHAKFVVVDDEVALISSANMESRALQEYKMDGPTGECGIVMRNKPEVLRCARFFTRLWFSGCQWESRPGQTYAVAKRSSALSPCTVDPLKKGRPGVIWTAPGEDVILETIQDIISRAQKELLLSSFSLKGMTTHPDLLLGRLEAAARKGVSIRIMLRARNNMEEHRRDAEAMLKAGISVHADSLNHAKGVVADRKLGAIFSANFDADHGLTTGVEAGVRLHECRALSDTIRYFLHAMDNADTELVLNPTHQDMNDRLAVGWKVAWPYDKTVHISCAKETWGEFTLSAGRGPVLFVTEVDGTVQILADTATFTLRPVEGRDHYELQSAGLLPSEMLNTSRLIDVWLRRRGPINRRGGFCPAVFVRPS